MQIELLINLNVQSLESQVINVLCYLYKQILQRALLVKDVWSHVCAYMCTPEIVI